MAVDVHCWPDIFFVCYVVQSITKKIMSSSGHPPYACITDLDSGKQPRYNGGWFAGDPFCTGATWGPVPARPSASYLTSRLLVEKAVPGAVPPPPGAAQQFSGTQWRPGNTDSDATDVGIGGPTNALGNGGGGQTNAFAKHVWR
jgi:hypothetical protein